MTLRPLLVTENYPPGRGGMAQSCDRIVRGLRARGVTVDVAHLGARRGEGVAIERQERGRLLRCAADEDPAHAANVLWNALAHDSIRPSHVIAFGGLGPLLCAPAFAAWLQRPLLTLLRGNDFDTGLFSLRRGWMLRDALARSSAVCVVSTEHREKVSLLYPQQRVDYIPNGIDLREWELLDPDRAQAAAWRSRTLAPGQRVLGLFGHLKRKKGGLFLLDALERCRHAARLHVLVVGEIEPAMAERLAALPPEIGRTQLPFLDRYALLPWYAACDAVAIPSLYDGMPNVALEAGALGVPLLGATVGGLRDVFGPGNEALTFAPGDVYACRRALDAVAELPEAELAALGARLAERVRRDFDHAHEAERYHALLAATADATPSVATAPALTLGE